MAHLAIQPGADPTKPSTGFNGRPFSFLTRPRLQPFLAIGEPVPHADHNRTQTLIGTFFLTSPAQQKVRAVLSPRSQQPAVTGSSSRIQRHSSVPSARPGTASRAMAGTTCTKSSTATAFQPILALKGVVETLTTLHSSAWTLHSSISHPGHTEFSETHWCWCCRFSSGPILANLAQLLPNLASEAGNEVAIRSVIAPIVLTR
ncbi:hypothetical protein EDB81DRAFT_94102 [Dactylonectria macrodidyma]|uniref:Uncharacterized protein n=1 Tax=Dactylonectria macrodidyma TaxID=307937 RepID=A0A9P9IUR7_9HYPO|nr:hypothetical protein EDB81DRAFT_94102 [Dactylonectria macrodidyma]